MRDNNDDISDEILNESESFGSDIILEESSSPDSLNDKQQLVLDMLRQIIAAYNNCLNPTETTEDAAIVSVDATESDDNQDLPF